MRAARTLLILSMVTFLFAPHPAVAFHETETLAEVYFTSSGWAAWRFNAPARAFIEIDYDWTFSRANMVFGAWAIDGAGKVYTEGRGSTSSEPGTYVRLHAAGQHFDTYEETRTGSGGSGFFFSRAPAGTYTAVVAVAGSGVDLPFRLEAAKGSTLLGATTGTGTFLHRTGDFVGDTHVAAAAGGAGVQVMQGAKVTELIAARLFGWFFEDFSVELGSVGYTGPDGTHTGEQSYDIIAGPAGTYEFHADSISAGFQGLEAFGADVVMP